MKKFLLLPVVLAVGFGILILISSGKPGDDTEKEGDVFDVGAGNYVTAASGLKYRDLKVGDGKEAKPHDTVVVHYTGWLKDGTKFDSSRDRHKAAEFSLDEVVQGWGEGIPGMKVGGKRRLVIPPELGYGKKGRPGIPPDSELTFTVELIDVK
jgi:FKBP-type peptidyl-prolyl cis-trans isomerase FkpA